MFGVDGTRLRSMLLGHFDVHFRSDPQLIYSRTSLQDTLRTISLSRADVVGICEILNGQKEQIREGLLQRGYTYCLFGAGHKTKFNQISLNVLVAAKMPLVHVVDTGFPVKDTMGGGGGYVHCYIPALNTDLFCVHLALGHHRKLYELQMNYLREKISLVSGPIIVIGDFNTTFVKMKSKFMNLTLVSNRMKTCSRTAIIKMFCDKDLDHVFVRGFRGISATTFLGKSDHEMIVVEVDKVDIE